MTSGQMEFENRLQKLLRKHRAMARGYTTRMRADGLIVVKPKRPASPISARAVLIFLMIFVTFKGFVIANLGVPAYEERVARLMEGNVIEQAGGFAMKIDPVSEMAAASFATVLR